MTTISDNLQQVRERMDQACARWGRAPVSVQLLAVSKACPAQAVALALQAGQSAFGENYVQEGVEKITRLRTQGAQGLQWHCIGPLQSNKTRLVAEHFDWVHTVDRLKIAERLSLQRPAALAPLQVCLQVNIDGGKNKSGAAPHELLDLARGVISLPRLRLRGLMCIPEPAHDFGAAKAVFEQARRLYDDLLRAGLEIDTLSMGMSEDLEAAIAAGSTMVRIGTAIFGPRPAPGQAQAAT